MSTPRRLGCGLGAGSLFLLAFFVILLPGFLMGAGPLFRLLHLEGDTFSRFENGGWYNGCDPTMSPDGKRIVYSSPRSGRGDLYTVRTDGTGTRRLTSDPRYEAEATFSPDGRLIAYVKQVHDVGDSYKAQIFVMNSDGSAQRQITRGDNEHFRPAFLPDGKSLLCTRSANHVILGTFQIPAMDGSTVERKVAPGWEAVQARHGAILYTAAAPAAHQNRSDHYVWTQSSSGAAKSLVPGWSPAISPDGKLITCVGEPYSQTLFLLNSDGTNRRQIYSHDRHYLEHPTFEPDGKHILLHEITDRGIGNIVIVTLDGKNATVIASAQ